jgi:hypothetical protein
MQNAQRSPLRMAEQYYGKQTCFDDTVRNRQRRDKYTGHRWVLNVRNPIDYADAMLGKN